MIVDCEFRIAERDESGKQALAQKKKLWPPPQKYPEPLALASLACSKKDSLARRAGECGGRKARSDHDRPACPNKSALREMQVEAKAFFF